MWRSIQGYPSSNLLAGLEKAKLGGETPPKAFREGRFQLRDGILKLVSSCINVSILNLRSSFNSLRNQLLYLCTYKP